MRGLYHVNPETGEPGRCRALLKCRFNASSKDHYRTEEEARAAYEEGQVLASQSLFSTVSRKDLSVTATLHQSPPMKVLLKTPPSHEKLLALAGERLKKSLFLKDLEELGEVTEQSPVPMEFGGGRQWLALELDAPGVRVGLRRGPCPLLAWELYQRSGLPIALLSLPKESPKAGWRGHAAVLLPDGRLLDSGGARTVEEVRKEFEDSGGGEAPLEVVSEEEFLKRMGVNKQSQVYEDLEDLEVAFLSKASLQLLKEAGL